MVLTDVIRLFLVYQLKKGDDDNDETLMRDIIIFSQIVINIQVPKIFYWLGDGGGDDVVVSCWIIRTVSKVDLL